MTTKEHLQAARALIENPANWKRGYSRVVPTCALGALNIARGHVNLHDPAYRALNAAMGEYGIGYYNDIHTHAEVLAAFDGIGYYNDIHTHAEVLAAFDRAIASC